MKLAIAFVLTALSSVAFAADKTAPTTYVTHFENPIVDDRLAFSSCAVSGALIGIAKGTPGDVLCTATLKSDTSKKPRSFYVYKAEKRKTYEYFEETSSKLIRSVGEQAGGEQEWTVKLQEVNDDLTVPARPHVGTLNLLQSWDYSEGSMMVRGHLPGIDTKFEGPSFGLDSVDEELREFLGEIGGK